MTLIPDGNGEFTDKMGMLVDKSAIGFGKRSWRYSMVCIISLIYVLSVIAEVLCVRTHLLRHDNHP